MARYRTHTIEFERQVAGEHLVGGTSLNQLARRHDISRELLRTWVKKHEAGEFASGGSPRADRRAYEAEIATRDPPPGCVRHSDRGSRYASEPYRTKLAEQGLKGSMGRRGNPYDNAKAESLMKTLEHEEVHLSGYETFQDLARLPASSRRCTTPGGCTPRSGT